MPKDLFADDLDGPLDVKVNSGFATKFEQVKRKQELQVLNSKHGKTNLDDDPMKNPLKLRMRMLNC